MPRTDHVNAPAASVHPLAAVLGNATLLGLGYLMTRRYVPFAFSLIGTGVLVGCLAAWPDSVLWRIVFAAWWFAIAAHTWATRRRDAGPLLAFDADFDRDRRGRGLRFAAAAAVLVLAAVALLKLDAWLLNRAAVGAHTEGDCDAAVESIERLSLPHRVVAGPVTVAAETERDACEVLLAALDGADPDAMAAYLELPGARWDLAGLERAAMLLDLHPYSAERVPVGFAQLATVLETHPEQSAEVRATVEAFLTGLHETPCRAAELHEWLYSEDWEAPELREPVEAARESAAEALLSCAREIENGEPYAAQAHYTRFIADYPDRADEAAAALAAVELEILRIEVTESLTSGDYCAEPIAYPSAPAYSGEGDQPIWPLGLGEDPIQELPASWTTTEVDEAAVVACVDYAGKGSVVDTCAYYEPSQFGLAPLFPETFDIDFYASAYRVEAYELRTGALVEDYEAEIGGGCPDELEWYEWELNEAGDLPTELLAPTEDADYRAVFEPLRS